MATKTSKRDKKAVKKRNPTNRKELLFWHQLNEQGLSDLAAGKTNPEIVRAWKKVAKRLADPSFSRKLFSLLGADRKSPLCWLLNDATRGRSAEKNHQKWFRTLFVSDGPADSQRRRIAQQIGAKICHNSQFEYRAETVFDGLGAAFNIPAGRFALAD